MIDCAAMALMATGVILAFVMLVHYIRLKDGRAKIGLAALVAGIWLGQVGNLTMLLLRQYAPETLDTMRAVMLAPQALIVAAMAWLVWVSFGG